MVHPHYPLQALLYAVALHRYLRGGWPTTTPERHLGGVGYLFLRGMAAPRRPGSRVRLRRVRLAAAGGLVEELSDLLDGGEEVTL